ncbi:MAG: hypothetical protein OHK0028_18300 [Deltaproteobacteria bacterium]
MRVKIPAGRDLGDRAIAWAGGFLFVVAFFATVLATLPADVIVSVLRGPLRAAGADLSAEDAGFTFPLGIRLSKVALTLPGNPSIALDEVTASWEWTGLFRGSPARLRLRKGSASADLRFSPMFWNPGSGRVLVSGFSSADIPVPVFSTGDAGFSIRRVEARWRRNGGTVSAEGTGTLHYLQVPVPAPDSPIRSARIDGVDLSFVIRGGAFQVPRLTGTFVGSAVDGTGEISQVLSPGRAAVTFHLRVRNPFEGRVAALFDMLSKNAKNVTLRIVGSLAAPTGEFQFF